MCVTSLIKKTGIESAFLKYNRLVAQVPPDKKSRGGVEVE